MLSALMAVGLWTTSANISSAADGTMIAARQRFFGAENVDPLSGRLPEDKVIVSWLTNTTFAVSIAGRVVLLDTFLTRLEVTAGRTPFVIKDVVALQPEAILLGHGHGDHADNAAYIAAMTGATIYASAETCAAMQVDFNREQTDPVIQGNAATRFPPNAAVICKDVTTAGSVPATQVLKLDLLEPDACVIAFRHLHSTAVPVDPTWPKAPSTSIYASAYTLTDSRDPGLFPSGTGLTPSSPIQPGQMNIKTSGSPGPGGPVAIYYHFVVRGGRHFTLAWHNTIGALKEGQGMGYNGTPADGQRIVQVLQSLPQTDVELGSVATANYANNAFRDPFAYIQALKPKIFIPTHLTFGLLESSSLAVYGAYLDQLQRLGISSEDWPDTHWLVDPADYARPIVFEVNDPAWADHNKGPRIAKFCGGDSD
jgi:hypothetical protein